MNLDEHTYFKLPRIMVHFADISIGLNTSFVHFFIDGPVSVFFNKPLDYKPSCQHLVQQCFFDLSVLQVCAT